MGSKKALEEIHESADEEMHSNLSESEEQILPPKQPQNDESDQSEPEEEEYQVEEIRNHRDTDEGRKYEVKWIGWASDDNTWEPMENLAHCKELVSRYDSQHNVAPKNNEWMNLTLAIDGKQKSKSKKNAKMKTF